MSSNFGGIPLWTGELGALECGKKYMYNLVRTLAHSFLVRSSSFLQVRKITIISRMSSNYGPIRPRTAELAALERLKKNPIDL